MPHRPRSRRTPSPRRVLTATAAAAWLLLAGCFQQNAAPEGPAVEVTSAVATSNTSFLLRFSRPLGEGADVASNYLVRDPDDAVLPVVAAHPIEGGAAVALATEPQAAVDYTLTVRNVSLAGGEPAGTDLIAPEVVPGSAAPAPFVADAVALSNTSVLVTFGDEDGALARMSDEALNTAAYRFEPALTVHEAAFSDDGAQGGRVVLTTASMAGRDYRLQVGAVTTRGDAALLDPFRDERSFVGIAAIDETPPTLTEAYATDAGTVIVAFSEPVRDHAADPSRYTIRDGSGQETSISGASPGVHGTRVTLATSALDATASYTVTAAGIEDLAGNALAAGAEAAFRGVAGGSDGTAPRVTSATSTGPTRVLVAFSEPVRGGAASAENPEHYAIVGSDTLAGSLATQAIVGVEAAELADDGRSVVLTTLPQSEIEYTLRVTNVVDLDGNAVIGPTRDQPFAIEFFGSAESGSGVDSDGDGLTDAAEGRGWTVAVVGADGGSSTREVTSDPYSPDTDEDGLPDRAERVYRTDPRAADSDGDDLSDARELNETYSSPVEVDSDADGLHDGLEVDFYGTSPRTGDTDGDQFTDDYEVDVDNRNPRLADLPRIRIDVGSVDLRLDVRFEEESSQGTSVVDSTSVTSTLYRSEESARSRETSSALEWFVQGGVEVCVRGGCQEGKWGGAKFSAEGGASGSTTTTNTTASVEATQREYAKSLATDATVSAESTLTRVVEGASMAVQVDIANVSDVGFTVRNVEITALIRDPRDPNGLVPVATLFSASGESVSIGPLSSARGPFRYASEDVYPGLIESLMRNPRGLEFRVANYDIVDEHGRDFAFVEEDVNDRTAYLEIDFAGNRPLERHQVATNATFDADGASVGITMAQVMEDVFGLTYVPAADDETLDPDVRADAELIETSYSTREVAGVDVLWRVKDVSSDLTDQERDWWVLGPEGNMTPVGGRPGTDFRDAVLHSDQDFALAFVQDLDDDDLEASVEVLYRSIDSDRDDDGDDVPDSRDTDRDGIDDGDEVLGPFDGVAREPWTIRLEDGRDAYRTSSHPGRADADGDGLSDCQELLLDADCAEITVYLDGDGVPTIEASSTDGAAHTLFRTTTLTARTDPAHPDTDGDGFTDLVEAIGFRYRDLDDAVRTVTPDSDATTPYATNPLAVDTDFDGLNDRAEAKLGSDPVTPDGDTVRDDDADGLVNRIEDDGWSVSWTDRYGGSQQIRVVPDRRSADSDGDGLGDWEEYHGCRDVDADFACDGDGRFGRTDATRSDTDADGVRDRAEVEGVEFPGDPEDPFRVLDPLRADSDGDGLTDGVEVLDSWMVYVEGQGGYRVWSDPLRPDADGDGLSDGRERREGTDPRASDTDGDGALDALEASAERATDPLVPDHLVTVTYLGLQTGKGGQDANADCDDGSNPGDFDFVFSVGLSSDSGFERQGVASHDSVPDVRTCNDGNDGGPCRSDTTGSIQLASPFTLTMNESTSVGVPFSEIVTVEGWVQEVEPTGADLSYYFGGIGSPDGVYDGASLGKGSFSIAFNDPPQALDNRTCQVEVTVQVQVE